MKYIKTRPSHLLGQEMIEALFSVLLASMILTSAFIVFTRKKDEIRSSEKDGFYCLKEAQSWRGWRDGSAIDLQSARMTSIDDLKTSWGIQEDFSINFYGVNNTGRFLIFKIGSIPEKENLNYLSCPVLLSDNGSLTAGVLEVVI